MADIQKSDDDSPAKLSVEGGESPPISEDAESMKFAEKAMGALRRFLSRFKKKADRAIDDAAKALEEKTRKIDEARGGSAVWKETDAQRKSLEEMQEKIDNIGRIKKKD